MSSEHTVRSYDEDLAHLVNLIARMGGLAEAQLEGAIQALVKRDVELAGRIVASDSKVDELESEVHNFAVQVAAAVTQPLEVGDLPEPSAEPVARLTAVAPPSLSLSVIGGGLATLFA